jgi:hypothetical protein
VHAAAARATSRGGAQCNTATHSAHGVGIIIEESSAEDDDARVGSVATSAQGQGWMRCGRPGAEATRQADTRQALWATSTPRPATRRGALPWLRSARFLGSKAERHATTEPYSQGDTSTPTRRGAALATPAPRNSGACLVYCRLLSSAAAAAPIPRGNVGAREQAERAGKASTRLAARGKAGIITAPRRPCGL